MRFSIVITKVIKISGVCKGGGAGPPTFVGQSGEIGRSRRRKNPGEIGDFVQNPKLIV